MKPSPVPSILLLIATAVLAFSLLGRGWSTHDSDTVSVHSGPVWGEVCVDMGEGRDCKTHTVFSNLDKNIGGMTILGLLFVACGLGGMICAGIAGILLFSKPRSALTLVALILIGVATVIMLGLFFYGMSRGGRFELPGYAFFLYFIGAALAIVGSILGMSSKRGGLPAHPGYGRPPGYPPGPGQPGYGMGGYPPAGYQPGYPQPGYQQGSPQPGYQPPGYPQPAPTPPLAAPDYARAAPQAPAPQTPMHSCGLPMAWDPRYQRWACQRCGE